MATEIRPLGVSCNIQCLYCYQNPQRDAGNINTKYNLPKMLETADQIRWLEEILQWPLSWTSLHGIAELKTPILKLIYSTDISSQKVCMGLEGNRYPAEGASGVTFPFHNIYSKQYTTSKAYRKGISHVQEEP